MSGTREVNLDTSVLLNYVYSKLPGEIEEDRGSIRLIESDGFYCVIGGKASGEFNALCDRRYDLYDDLVDWLEENPEESIYDYDPTSRDVPTSRNDLDHLRLEVQYGWGNDPRRKQLADFRRCMQDLDAFQDNLPNELIDEVYRQFDNEELAEELEGLDLDHDIGIIIDAVAILQQDGIEMLTAVDSDITDEEQSKSINEIISEVEGDDCVLILVSPDTV